MPAGLDWDLWLGPAAERPVLAGVRPVRLAAVLGLRRRHAHRHGLPPRGPAVLGAGAAPPDAVEREGPAAAPRTAPTGIVCDYEFPARGELPAVKLTWYDGGKRPKHFAEGKLPKWGDGTLFVGEKGMLLADYGRHVLLPEKDFKDVGRPKESIPNSVGHHKEWIEACKTGGHDDVQVRLLGALTEAVLLGSVSYRAGKPLEWDPKASRRRASRRRTGSSRRSTGRGGGFEPPALRLSPPGGVWYNAGQSGGSRNVRRRGSSTPEVLLAYRAFTALTVAQFHQMIRSGILGEKDG